MFRQYLVDETSDERINRFIFCLSDDRVAWWSNDRASNLRSRGRGFDPRPGRNCVTTLGKSLTPACLDADSLRYHMESLNGVPLPLSDAVVNPHHTGIV